MKKILIIFSLSLFSFAVCAQHEEAGEHGEFHPHHMLGLVVSHTMLSEGVDASGHKNWKALPSWALNYNYRFHPKWAIGLHNDIITETFEVKDHLGSGHETLERSYPIASAVMVSYKPGKHFNYMLGPGGEFAKEASYFLIRAGVEYECHISKGWELNAEINNDFKVNAYNSFGFGIGVTRVF